MNYELAGRLKEAGFRQSLFPSKNFCPCADCTIETCGTWICGHERRDFITFPTLEELIEAIKEPGFAIFGPIEKTPDYYDMEKVGPIEGIVKKEGSKISDWVAVLRHKDMVCHGQSPSEAVANLWLSLNEKSGD